MSSARDGKLLVFYLKAKYIHRCFVKCNAKRIVSTFRAKPYLFYFDLTKCISYATALGGCQTPQVRIII